MGYSASLLRRAVKAAGGSRYALSKLTDLPESHLSEVWHGKRRVPAAWVLPLAKVAGVDPADAMERHARERKLLRRMRIVGD